jgi:hypothetical protein
MAKSKTVKTEAGEVIVVPAIPAAPVAPVVVAKTAAEILNTEIGEWSAYCVVKKTIAYTEDRKPLRGTRAEADAAAAGMARGVVCKWDELMDRITSGFPYYQAT